MYRLSQIVFSAFFVLLFCSCSGQVNTNDICKRKFKEARDLAYANSACQSALNAALSLINECLQCDSIRKAVVDFKITLLMSMKKYAEGISFINSLKENDFTFGYKKNLLSKNLEVLYYSFKNDTTKQKLMYKEIANDLEQYVRKHKISDKEFKEIYTNQFAIKQHFLNTRQINKEVEALRKRYPERETFFNFFKR